MDAEAGPSGLPGGAPPPAPDGIEPFYSRETGKWTYETEAGEHEWNPASRTWNEVVDDETIRRQQAAYSIAGVDEEAPAYDPRDKKAKKRSRKAADAETKPKRAGGNTAIYISNLPDDPPPTVDELASTFNRAGLILEGVDGQPKIKLYSGESAGKALVVYLKEESIELAITLFDGAPLRIGGNGALKVEKATFEHKKPADDATAEPDAKRPKRDEKRAKQGKKAERLRAKLEDWSSDEDAPDGPPASVVSGKNARVVVLARMFTLAELESDPALLIDLKEDVRDECEQTCGKVNSVQLYDLEPDGVMTVKFGDPIAAKACVLKMNGRFFGGRQVIAGLYDGKHRYRKSGRGGATGEDEGKTEAERLEAFSRWLELDQHD